MKFLVQFWRNALFAFKIRDYKFAWEIRCHAYDYLANQFWCASRRERGCLLPEQAEALEILSGGFENGALVPVDRSNA